MEIAPNATPPVCKIIDYSKFKYEQKKKQKELKANAHKVVVKEIRFGPNTNEHDLDFKTKHAQKFLEEGNKVKAYVQFAGRTIVFKERGREILDRFSEGIEEFGKPEGTPKMEGKRMIIMFTPKAIPKKKPTKEEADKVGKPERKKLSAPPLEIDPDFEEIDSEEIDSEDIDSDDTEFDDTDSKKNKAPIAKKSAVTKKSSPKKVTNDEEE